MDTMQVTPIPDTWNMVAEVETKKFRHSLKNIAGFVKYAEEHPTDIWILRMAMRSIEISVEFAQKDLDELGIPRVQDLDALDEWWRENRQP